MLPVIAPARLVAGRIVAYSWAMVLASLLLWPVAHTELVYPIVAVIAGGWFLTETYALRQRVRSGVPPKSMRLFHASISYLSILFIAAALSALLPG
jgi:protoheme IX farnesyltransferase